MDSDIFWDKYEADIRDWSAEKIVRELELVRRDFNEGMIDPKGYTRSKEMLENELHQKLGSKKTLSPSEAYDRAMQGI